MPWPRGVASPFRKTDQQRLLDGSALRDNGCREWARSKVDGYGRIKIGRPQRHALAHRLSYALAHDLPLDSLDGQIGHLCRNRGCIEPSHLELVTPSENVRRSFRARGIVRKERPTKGRRMRPTQQTKA